MTLPLKRVDLPLYVITHDGRCIVRGCSLMAIRQRLTSQSGFVVPYCEEHEQEAYELFGREGAD